MATTKKPKLKSKLDVTDGRLKQNRKPKTVNSTTDGKIINEENAENINSIYCRRCMTDKKPLNFYKATDMVLDKNTYMSICKDCCRDLYNKYYQLEHDLEKSILRLCRTLNWKYDTESIDALKNHLNNHSKSPDDETVSGTYRAKLSVRRGQKFGDFVKVEDYLTFNEPSREAREEIDDDAFGSSTEDLKLFWGAGLSYSDYVFLESELAKYKASHPSDSYSKVSLLKDLCHKELEIRKARFEEKSTGGLIKEKQDIMKTLAIDPAKESIASGNKNMEAFGVFIQHIEETEPADYYADKEIFKDADNIGWYFEKYVRRPLKNFVTGSRDFNVDANDENDEDDFDDFDKFAPPLEEGKENGGEVASI